MVARLVPRKEMYENPRARDKLDFEWNRLRSHPTWDEEAPREWADVAQEARQQKEKVHFARLIELVYEKGSELEADDANRDFRGRVVVGGDRITDEVSEAALFQHLGSAPVTFLANKLLDAITLFEAAQQADGKPPPYEPRIIEQSDAQQAYTQSPLGGTETWVYLPPHRWPKSWKGKYHKPVCKLLRALYGHPDAGGYWEKKCDEHMLSVGFIKVPNWPSCYLHPQYRLFLTICFDAFKMVQGPTCRWVGS